MATQPLETEEEGFVEGAEDGAEDEGAQTGGEEDQQGEEGQSGGEDPTEETARQMGWKPKEEFGGNPDDWVDWQEFLDVDQIASPQLRARNRTLGRRLDQAERKAKRLEKDMRDLKGFYERSEQRGYERARAELLGKQRDAAADADIDAYDSYSEQLAELDKEKPGAELQPDISAEESQKVFMKWHAKRGWYGKDTQKTAAFDAIAMELGDFRQTDFSPAEYLEEVERMAKEEYPEAFMGDKPQQQAAPRRKSPVGGVSEGRGRQNAETFENLPNEAKAQYTRFEKMGYQLDKADFAKDAWQQIKAENA